MKERISAPSPTVQHLPTIFRRIETGEIKVPTFQRGFVWQEPQVIELLESVYKGYPIGSLLFWKVESEQIDPGHLMAAPFPLVQERYPLVYVLDGQQRLATLYGCFHATSSSRPVFRVGFDLESERFFHLDEEAIAPIATIPLSDLFSPRRFLDAQRRLSTMPAGEVLIERSVNLHSTFQEYMLPIVTIEDRPVGDVVNIFERINNTGVRLGAVDFMRAVTWSSRFDLNQQVTYLEKVAAEQGYAIPAETLVKILATTMNRDPVVEDMLKLRAATPDELRRGIEATARALMQAIEFLRREFRILSYELLPYEGLFIIICRLFSLATHPAPQVLDHVKRWFWSVGFSEALRGKPDHYVARAIKGLKRLLEGDFSKLRQRFTLSISDLLERRFIRGKALSSSLVMLYAANNGRSFVTGEIIPAEIFMDEFESQDYRGLLSSSEVSRGLGRSAPAKIFANTILVPERNLELPVERSGLHFLQWVRERFGEESQEILHSQFIEADAVSYLELDDPRGFLAARASAIMRRAEEVSVAPEPL